MIDKSLSLAYELTHALQDAISQGAYTTAAQLAEKRSPLLMRLTADQTPEALKMIREIQRIDAAIMQQAEAGRDQLAARQSAAVSKIEAARQYQATGMMSTHLR
ncbi:flagellar protein FliT [Paraburkholderia phymatum]|uniref:Flagellar protein FliT n=1 Tax=Paraburkholderia phymatum TaxID=148447 RepID=A0ACC6UD30_9BURK